MMAGALLYNVKDAYVAVTVAVGGFGEITVRKMLNISDVRKCNSVTVFSYYICYVIFRVRAE